MSHNATILQRLPAWGETVRVEAILYDDLQRVLQVRDSTAREWQIPSAEVPWTDEAAAVNSALNVLNEVVTAPVSASDGRFIHWSVENNTLRMAFVFNVVDARALAYSPATAKRWAPWDTLKDLPLGQKLSQIS